MDVAKAYLGGKGLFHVTVYGQGTPELMQKP